MNPTIVNPISVINPILIKLNDYVPISSDIIRECMIFVRANIDCHFEITEYEHNVLVQYSEMKGVNYSVLLGLRSTAVVHQYMTWNNKPNNIIAVFRSSLRSHNLNIINFIAYNFYKDVGWNPNIVYKTIKKTPEYLNAPKNIQDDLSNVIKSIKEKDERISQYALRFEDKLRKYFNELGIDFRSEKELRDAGAKVTLDIVFDESIFIQIDDKIMEINWLDAKNYMCIGKRSFLFKGLKKQAKRFNDAYGEGGFVFAQGYVSNVNIVDTWLFSADSFNIVTE